MTAPDMAAEEPGVPEAFQSSAMPVFPFPDLNAPQREAVEAPDGPLLVLSGAGTGKTRVLTARLAWMLLSHRVSPRQIFAVTFTNRAAKEMSERVASLLQRPVEGWYLGTFHALAARLLRRHAERVGLQPNFTILDDDDQQRLIKQLLQAENIDEKASPPRLVHAVITRWKDKAKRPEQISAAEAGDLAQGRMRKLYAAYQARLLSLNACDFADLLLYNLDLLQHHTDLRQHYQDRFRAVLVDEYQDTNVTQYLWLRLLTAQHQNLTAVGDDDQSIYSWRGAEVGNILKFSEDFPGAKIIRLEQNYRSTGHILGAAASLIAHNKARLGKTLWTDGEAGEKVRLYAAYDSLEEARYVADEIEQRQRAGEALAQMAVLVRTGAQTREFEERFVSLGIPYRVIGGPRFYERQEIRDAIAYFRATLSIADDLAFERILNLPRRGIGATSLKKLHAGARALGQPMQAYAQQLVRTDELSGKLRTSLSDFLAQLEMWRQDAAQQPHPELARRILDESGYTAMWQQDKSAEAPVRLENLKELINALAEFGSLTAFLEHVALVMEQAGPTNHDTVTLMTLHAAKGLEFNTVFLAGWEEDLFPSRRALEENGTAALEEERRLAYVGLTRARARATVSYAHSRRLYGQWSNSLPSRFIGEISSQHWQQSQVRPTPPARHSPYAGASHFGAGNRGGNIIEGRARTLPKPMRAPAFERLDRVRHEKFGIGIVQAVDDDLILVRFSTVGEKTVIAQFLLAAEE